MSGRYEPFFVAIGTSGRPMHFKNVLSCGRSFEVRLMCRPLVERFPSVAMSPIAYASSGDQMTSFLFGFGPRIPIPQVYSVYQLSFKKSVDNTSYLCRNLFDHFCRRLCLRSRYRLITREMHHARVPKLAPHLLGRLLADEVELRPAHTRTLHDFNRSNNGRIEREGLLDADT